MDFLFLARRSPIPARWAALAAVTLALGTPTAVAAAPKASVDHVTAKRLTAAIERELPTC
ncbi:MAG TPA: hypothetical protein VFJ57_07295 [Solirubrobacterales bacterium]|nr:hypothetical protein [Solirubrobacterales bacterium]